MLIHRELIISRKNLQEKSYAPQQTTNKEIEELAPSEKEEFLLPAVELLYSIYKEGGFGPDADDKEDRDLC